MLIIVGARGLGRCVASQALGDYAHNREWTLMGFLDSGGQAVLPPACTVPVLGDPASWQPHPQQYFLPAIGDAVAKKKFLAPLIEKGAQFMDLRTRVSFGDRSTWGKGTVFGLGSEVSTDTVIEDYVYIDNGVTVGHDCVIGQYSHIGGKTFIAGGVSIGECVTVHAGAVIGKGVRIGNGAVVGLGAVVLRDVPENTFVLGNPARMVREIGPGLEEERETEYTA